MKDSRFLLITGLVSISLAIMHGSLFIKSLGNSKLANNQLKQAASQVETKGFRKKEQKFWDSIKEFNFDDTSRNHQNPNNQNQQKIESSEPAQEPKTKSPELTEQEKPLTRFLLVGDSIMYTFGVEFKNAAQKSDYKFDEIEVVYENSTGLNRIDYFDWYQKTNQVVSKYQPDAVVVLFGGNDAQDIRDKDGKYRTELTPEWKAAYRERVERYAKQLDKSSVRKVYWIGHPISNQSRPNQFFPIFNEIYRDVSQSYPKIEFIDNWETFAANGKFTPSVADKSGKKGRVRVQDGYHFTHHGAKILVDNFIETMKDDGVLQKKAK